MLNFNKPVCVGVSRTGIRIEKGVFPDVVFSIRNNGDRLVDDLRVRMVYRSAEGSIMAVELGRIDRYNMAFYPGHDYENERWSPWQAPFDWDMENFEFAILEALGPVADDQEVWARSKDIARIYDEPIPALIEPMLEKYNVRYIVVGPLERSYYAPDGLEKFEQMVDEGKLRAVFRNEGVTIYEVPGSE